jgi:Uma2 family endonuclease
MSMITAVTPHLAPSSDLVSGLYRLTVRQYHMMIEDGTLAEDDRVELIEGLLVEKLGRKRPQVQAGKKGLRELLRIVPPGWHVAKEDPIVTSEWSKPEPDLAVVRGDVDSFRDRDVTAADVALVIEIAETSLVADRTEMLRVYASAGIPCYWIVNLIERKVEVYTDVDAAAGTYRSRSDRGPDEHVDLVIGGRILGSLAVSDLLP